MYLVGAEHPNRDRAQSRLEDLVARGQRLATDVEVLQEILHRYTAIKRPEAIQPAFDVLLGVVDEVVPVTLAEVEEAKRILFGQHGVSARDSLHLAVMRSRDIARVLSFDTDFDRFPGVERIS